MIVEPFRRLWTEGTKWAEISFAAGMTIWGGLHRFSDDPATVHVFGAGMGWISRPHLEWLFLLIGISQVLLALFAGRMSRILISGPAFFLNADVVLDVLRKGEFSSGAIGFFAAAAAINSIAILRNAERIHAKAAWSYG